MNPANVDIAVGWTAAIAGSTGTFIHLISTSLSLLTLLVNLGVGLGGMYLLYLRIKKAKIKKTKK